MNVLDLFSGIGGFSLGLERTGFRTVAFCEVEPYCRAVLAKHWPDIPCYDDVRTLTADRLAADGIGVDVICGGFPCQDISCAGKGAGLAGERSGLWADYARLIRELRPQFVIVENVAALLGRGLAEVLGDLASIGFDAEWHCIPASAVGAPHRRDRIWIVAYPSDRGLGRLFQSQRELWSEAASDIGSDGETSAMAHSASKRCGEAREYSGGPSERVAVGGEVLADTNLKPWNEGWAGNPSKEQRGRNTYRGCISADVSDANGARLEEPRDAGESPSQIGSRLLATTSGNDWWAAEPDVGRVAHGIPNRVDRLRALGNAVVPQIPEIIGRAIMKAHLTDSQSEQTP